jgi:cell division septum initiation protein DivIVA
MSEWEKELVDIGNDYRQMVDLLSRVQNRLQELRGEIARKDEALQTISRMTDTLMLATDHPVCEQFRSVGHHARAALDPLPTEKNP